MLGGGGGGDDVMPDMNDNKFTAAADHGRQLAPYPENSGPTKARNFGRILTQTWELGGKITALLVGKVWTEEKIKTAQH